MTTAEWTADVLNILLIVLIVCVSVAGIIAVKGFIEERMLRKRSIRFALVFGFLFMVYLVVHVLADLNLLADWDALSGLREILPSGWAQIFLVLGLVGVTGFYALMAFRQARASVKMAEEMRKQRIEASRPVMIQKAVYKESGLTDLDIQYIGYPERSARSYFSHFEVYNAGNGPAIEVEIFLLNKEKIPVVDEEMKPISWRESFLRASDPAIKFRPSNIANLQESIKYYLVCEYQSVLSRETWYQTWLVFEPAKSSKEDEVFIVAGELEFKEEVTEKGRINAFGSGSKPK